MNYTRIYASIVLRAQSERTERLALKKQGKYFEDHHIIPRSLGGKDIISNMALLTGREHFICHWLLVKIYPPPTIEHEKMLYALWRMSSINDDHWGRYVNAHAYEYYRTEFAKNVSRIMTLRQTGHCNSQYGTAWYTNCYTGECCKSREELSYPWYKGRNLFHGEVRQLVRRSTTPCYKTYATKRTHVVNRRRKDCKGNYYIATSRDVLEKCALSRARQWWDEFHNGNYNNLEEFGKTVGKSKTAIYLSFNKYIPAFSADRQTRRRRFKSNIDLIGKYN